MDADIQRNQLQHIDCTHVLSELIENSFPFYSCHKLPALMNDALEAINSKHIRCSFCSESLLESISVHWQSFMVTVGFFEQFNSKEEFKVHCSEMIACKHICKAHHS